MSRSGEVRRRVRLRSGRHIAWRSAQPDDADLVWSWWTAPNVAYWSIAPRLALIHAPPHDVATVRAYLALPICERGNEPLIGLMDGHIRFAYSELYAKRDSGFASFDLVEDDARGIHLLVDPVAGCDRRTVFEMSVDGVDWQFSEWPVALHFVGDPDVRNRMMINLCKRLGMQVLALVELPYKTACLMGVSRDQWHDNRQRIEMLLES
jgi:hypothetical protein